MPDVLLRSLTALTGLSSLTLGIRRSSGVQPDTAHALVCFNKHNCAASG